MSFEQIAGKDIAMALKPRGICEPTFVQEKTIPLMIEGKDVIACSDTGTGKTLAYLIPAILKVDVNIKLVQVVVIVPTKELAVQVCAEANKLLEGLGSEVKAAAILGGVNINRQIDMLKEKPQIIAGQAARMLELVERRKLSMHNVKLIVFDEADKLLTGDISEITALVKKTMRDRQIGAFSASLNEKVKLTAGGLMNEPVEVSAERAAIPDNIKHTACVVTQRDKIKVLRRILHTHKQRALVFVNNPYTIEDVAERLNFHGIAAMALHGGKDGQSRRNAMRAFREGQARVLVASDVAARGLDIEGLTLIVNLDAPDKPRDYQHRAGRAGRHGEESLVVTLVTDYEKRFLRQYEKRFGVVITLETM